MEASKIGMVLAIGALLSHAPLSAQRLPIHIAVGLGPSIVDKGPSSRLSSPGFGSYAQLAFGADGLLTPFADLWLLSQAGSIGETPPCPLPPTPCGSSSTQGTVALVLSPALRVSERYEKATLLYRLGPSVDWFADRASSASAVTLGARAGFTIRTSRRLSGLLLSLDYFRAFRGLDRPRWFLPITAGWQF